MQHRAARMVWVGVFLAAMSVPCERRGAPEAASRPDEGNGSALGPASVVPGYDWSLPATVTPERDSGFFTMDGDGGPHDLIRHRGATVTWAALSPAEGVYDFSPVESRLRDAKESGGGLILRLKTSTVYEETPWGSHGPFIPKWVLEKHHPPVVDVNPAGSPIRVAVPWSAGVEAEYARLVHAFAARRFQEEPALLGLYVHGISTSLGEEMWLDDGAIDNLRAIGMTSCGLLTRAMEKRIQLWANAFGPARGKLVWMGSVWLNRNPCTNDDAHRMNQAALRAGLGLRYGSVDLEYNGAIIQPAPYSDLGQKLDSDGYLTTNWGWPVLAENRYWGDENEEYDTADPSAPYMYRNALLRSLQMGERLIWTTARIVNLDPALSRYWTLTAGKTARTSPDAWVSLREARVRFGGDCYTVKNFERWLHQRDAHGATSVPALYTRRAPSNRDCDLDGDGMKDAGEFDARSPDEKSNRMGFFLDGDFMSSGRSGNVELKVTFVNQGTPWTVEWCSAGGPRETGAVPATGDGKIKTATFFLPAFRPSRCIDGRFDLSLKTSGKLAVSFVRILGPS